MNSRNEAHFDRLDMFSEDQLSRYAGYHARALFASFGWDITEHDGGMDFLSFKAASPETGTAYAVRVFCQRDGFDPKKICFPYGTMPGSVFSSGGIIVYEQMLGDDNIIDYLFPTSCWADGDDGFKAERDEQGRFFLTIDIPDPLENDLMDYYFKHIIYMLAPLLPGEKLWTER